MPPAAEFQALFAAWPLRFYVLDPVAATGDAVASVRLVVKSSLSLQCFGRQICDNNFLSLSLSLSLSNTFAVLQFIADPFGADMNVAFVDSYLAARFGDAHC